MSVSKKKKTVRAEFVEALSISRDIGNPGRLIDLNVFLDLHVFVRLAFYFGMDIPFILRPGWNLADGTWPI
jgi:hypothetical protein